MTIDKTLHSIVDENGEPVSTAYSSPHWFVDSKDIVIENFCRTGPFTPQVAWGPLFSSPKRGHAVQFYTTGEAYFRQVATAIAAARSSVFIAGWQVNYDVRLTESATLFDCLLQAMRNGATVYVMPWLAPPGPVDTGYFVTMLAVLHLNAHPEAKGKAYCLPAIAQSDQETAAAVFSHHQKSVVIDNRKAFVGGIDLAYGRRDDGNFSLKAGWRTLSEAYNSCVPPVHRSTSRELADCVTPAELLAAAFSRGWARKAATFLSSPAEGGWAAAQDGWGAASAAARDAKDASAEFLGRINFFDDLYGMAQDAAMDGAQEASRWAWQKLDEATRARLKNVARNHGGNAANAISAVYAWLQGADLSMLPPEPLKEVGDLVHALAYGIAAATNAAASTKPEYYARLFEKIRSVPTGAYVLDTGRQPRMPWQDVQCCIEGPSVFDVSRNFVARWNGVASRFEKSYGRYRDRAARFLLDMAGVELPGTPKAPRIASAHLPTPGTEPAGTCWVQVLRSAPRQMQQDEFAGAGKPAAVALAQNNCLKGIVKVINSAQNFLYIEGQFFQSGHGAFGPTSEANSGPMGGVLDITRTPAHGQFQEMLGIAGATDIQDILARLRWSKVDDVLKQAGGAEYLQDLSTVVKNLQTVEFMRLLGKPQDRLQNPVNRALVNRIARAIGDELPFHVYLVLPVHPEGTLDTLNIMSQVHLTMHSLVFGDYSLVNGVRRAILLHRYRKEKKASKEAAVAYVASLDLDKLERAVGDAWKEYLTLLNLRNWDILDGKPVTEQIYVHSKLVIADDRVAVLGSANLNDRSLLGDRDSELAVVVTDESKIKVKLDGVNPVDCSLAVHTLRRGLWEKIFGLGSETRRAAALARDEILNSPAAPSTWRAIQDLASENAKAYENAFWFIPRSGARPEIQPKEPEDNRQGPPPASLWPTWKYESYLDHARGGKLLYRMPFDPLFWRDSERSDVPNSWSVPKNSKSPMAPTTAPEPGDIQGFVCALPTDWTYRENNLSIKTHIGVLAKSTETPDGAPAIAASSRTNPNNEETAA